MTDKDQIQSIITAYLSGKATNEERRELEDWVSQSSDNERCFQEMRNICQEKYSCKYRSYKEEYGSQIGSLLATCGSDSHYTFIDILHLFVSG